MEVRRSTDDAGNEIEEVWVEPQRPLELVRRKIRKVRTVTESERIEEPGKDPVEVRNPELPNPPPAPVAPAPVPPPQSEPQPEPEPWLGMPTWFWYGLLAGECVLGLYWLELI